MSHVSLSLREESGSAMLVLASSLSLLHQSAVWCLRIKEQPFPGLPYPSSCTRDEVSSISARGEKSHSFDLFGIALPRVPRTFFPRIPNLGPSQILGRRDRVNLLSQREFSHKIAQIITSTKSNGIVSFRSTLERNYLCWSPDSRIHSRDWRNDPNSRGIDEIICENVSLILQPRIPAQLRLPGDLLIRKILPRILERPKISILTRTFSYFFRITHHDLTSRFSASFPHVINKVVN